MITEYRIIIDDDANKIILITPERLNIYSRSSFDHYKHEIMKDIQSEENLLRFNSDMYIDD